MLRHFGGLVEVALQIVREGEMVTDVGMQRPDRRILRVRLSIGLDFIRLASHQRGGLFEIGHGRIEIAHRDVSMPAVTIEPRIVRVQRDTARVHVDRFPQLSEIAESPRIPEDRIDIGGGARTPCGLPPVVSRTSRGSRQTAAVCAACRRSARWPGTVVTAAARAVRRHDHRPRTSERRQPVSPRARSGSGT